jgi:hypothetical protein
MQWRKQVDVAVSLYGIGGMTQARGYDPHYKHGIVIVPDPSMVPPHQYLRPYRLEFANARTRRLLLKEGQYGDAVDNIMLVTNLHGYRCGVSASFKRGVAQEQLSYRHSVIVSGEKMEMMRFSGS